ncbi:methyltransferase domain-containing protein [Mangrovicoccus sp. HB161399]|uniref:methyltransferase domain-containing protein n=1 Tax=Mangrovicoccus sp. HB161399 TaxID=2720392 RepID=UPI001557B95A|nr:methyltransferase domain-containing protein [Mangrovicoccus sp. HB161399]
MTDAPVPLTDRAALRRARSRIAGPDALFLHALARDGIEERLAMVKRTLTDAAVVTGHPQAWEGLRPGARIVEDAELLDLQPGSCDLVVHAMALHWAEDPVGQLVQCRRALRPDGLLLAVFPGGQTLAELRAALAEAEAAATGGLSPRVLPMGEIRQLGALLQRAGLALPVADAERHDVQYRSALHLMQDLRAMGETNALAARTRRFTRREVLLEAVRRYPGAEDGAVHATFELITLTGWCPDVSQPQPLRPGSAAARLADVLNVSESRLPGEGN